MALDNMSIRYRLHFSAPTKSADRWRTKMKKILIAFALIASTPAFAGDWSTEWMNAIALSAKQNGGTAHMSNLVTASGDDLQVVYFTKGDVVFSYSQSLSLGRHDICQWVVGHPTEAQCSQVQ